MTEEQGQTAYGVSNNGVLDLNTLFAHPRGAMVNWLARGGVQLRDGTPDYAVRTMFLNARAKAPGSGETINHQLVKVRVQVLELVDAATVELAPEGS